MTGWDFVKHLIGCCLSMVRCELNEVHLLYVHLHGVLRDV